MRSFGQEQRGVAIRMAAALVVTVAFMAAAIVADRASTAQPLADRLGTALRVDIAVVAALIAAIANVARLRFFSVADIAGGSAGPGSAQVRAAAAILQNTLEQVVLAVATHLIVAATIDPSRWLIVALGALFAVGRALFWIGYGGGATARAFGFALTFYPSVAALALAALAVATGVAG